MVSKQQSVVLSEPTVLQYYADADSFLCQLPGTGLHAVFDLWTAACLSMRYYTVLCRCSWFRLKLLETLRYRYTTTLDPCSGSRADCLFIIAAVHAVYLHYYL